MKGYKCDVVPPLSTRWQPTDLVQGPRPWRLSGLVVEEADRGLGVNGESMGQAMVRAQGPEPVLLQGTRCRWSH